MRPEDLTDPDEVVDYSRQLVAAAFTAETERLQSLRDPTELTMSGLGGCTRAAAYAVAGTEASDVHGWEEARMAHLGTWIHEGLLPRMAEVTGDGAVFEQKVELKAAGLTLRGTLDLARDPVVWDLKTVREYRLHGVRRNGAYDDHRLQVLGYALARLQAGHQVRWVAWLYMDRATGEVHVAVEEFTNAAALAVIDRVRQIGYFADADPDTAPRDGRGPGLSLACDRCPWLRRCWGDDATAGQRGAQRRLAETDAGVEYALKLYRDGADLKSQGERDQDFAKEILTVTPPGVYGTWELRRSKPGTMRDQKQIAADYAEMGKQVPTTTTSGRLIVTPAARQ